MQYLLDTNPCIVFLNGRSTKLRDRINAEGDANIAVCSIVRAELYYGAAKSTTPDRTISNQKVFLSRFLSLAFDDAAARVYGPIRAGLEKVGATIGAHDLLIASIALSNNLTLVTHNIQEFSRIPGLIIEDWET
jgi:tRNA(fMet)-specific endonuclease VapC